MWHVEQGAVVVYGWALSNLCTCGPKQRVIVDGTGVCCQERWTFLGHIGKIVVSILGNYQSTCIGRSTGARYTGTRTGLWNYTLLYTKRSGLDIWSIGNVSGYSNQFMGNRHGVMERAALSPCWESPRLGPIAGSVSKRRQWPWWAQWHSKNHYKSETTD